jgi:hypothetical protein
MIRSRHYLGLVTTQRIIAVMSRTFPLNPPPNCPLCGSVAQRDLTKNLGSAGRRRPYYFCINNHKRKFVRWDDNEGISNNNPQCQCGHSSRLNVNGTSNWYDCSSMSCNFRSNAPANVDAVELDSTPSVHGVSAPSTYQGSQGSSTYPVVSGPDRYVQHDSTLKHAWRDF